MKPNVVTAIFRRNFLSYFNNPTGYVFICLFVVLSSGFAFWPNDFFANNLATLDQLNRYLPYILLVFIPAVTMATWADERRQGTDELLLTLPATDLDVVLGKYLAAVAVYSVALMFSAICNLLILEVLGLPDWFLFFTNYFGYWLIGAAMLSIGMVASFLTSNLTVAFILGMVLNVPLILLDWADAITGSDWTQTLKHWGLSEQFRDFGRGVVSLAATMYFLMLIVVMLYLCMVLIGRRHWLGGRDGQSLFGHYLLRAIALVVIVLGLDVVVESFDLRYDATAERVSSLTPDTIELIRNLDTKGRPVSIKAYVSPTVPESYAQTRLNLLNALREFEKLGRGKIQVQIISTEPTTEEATRAEQQFGIRPVAVSSHSQGVNKDEQIFLGVAVTCGLEKVVVPFIDRGMSIEYELIRSIITAGQEKRKRLGVVETEAPLFGGPDYQRMQMRDPQQIIDELEKQYEVVHVDASKPIEHFDVLLAVQPSSLAQPQMDNLIEAIRNGQPTAIFEDPLPVTRSFQGIVPATDEPRRGEMPGQAEPKGDIHRLWDLLGVRMEGKEGGNVIDPLASTAYIIWQNWNPYPKIAQISGLPREFVFIGENEPGGGKDFFNSEDPITSNLKEMWFPFPGAFRKQQDSKMKFVALVVTGDETGTVLPDQIRQARDDLQVLRTAEERGRTGKNYVLAARVTGSLKSASKPDAPDKDKTGADKDSKAKDKKDSKDTKSNDQPAKSDSSADEGGSAAAAEAAKKKAAQKSHPIDVVLVADIDLMENNLFQMRAHAEDEEGYGIHFDNIVFVLNSLDVLCGDMRFVEIRKHRPAHRTLSTIEGFVNDKEANAAKQQKDFLDKYDEARGKFEAEGAEAEKKFAELSRQADESMTKNGTISADLQGQLQDAAINQMVSQERVKRELDKLERDFQRQRVELDRSTNSEIRHEENFYKWLAVLAPPILPLVVAAFVFFSRRAQEREGVARSRLR